VKGPPPRTLPNNNKFHAAHLMGPEVTNNLTSHIHTYAIFKHILPDLAKCQLWKKEKTTQRKWLLPIKSYLNNFQSSYNVPKYAKNIDGVAMRLLEWFYYTTWF
jgi:hypothetical protein